MPASASGEGFWNLLADGERSDLSTLGRETTFSPGARMCVEGEPATNVFVIVEGWVKVLSVTSDGHQIILALRGQGDIVGELAGDADGYRTATVQAIEDVRSLVVPYAAFTRFLDANPGADRAYRHVVTQRWYEAAAMLSRRSTTTGAQRLAGLLLDLARHHGSSTEHGIDIVMPLSQEELASLVGASRATLTRALSNWRSRGLIRTGYRHMTIAGMEGLRKIARR
jgi:CRP/FNR family cyclic AMP-dependent transcriptional regulator